jgi:hypothetical protein
MSMSLIWTVPVVAALAATLAVVARSRVMEREVVALALEVARLRDLRRHFADVRGALAAVDAQAERLRSARGHSSP